MNPKLKEEIEKLKKEIERIEKRGEVNLEGASAKDDIEAMLEQHPDFEWLFCQGQLKGENKILSIVKEIIDEMIKNNEKKKKELVEKEAELIEVVPLIDYVACLNEVKNQLKEIN